MRNVGQAMLCLGTDLARAILLAQALKPVVAVPGQPALWRHAIESARAAEALAFKVGTIDPADAYTLGLLHDVGRLLLRMVPAEVQERRDRLERSGCARAVAEVVTSGLSHAEAGALVLKAWGLPQDYLTAVEYHHEPERSDSQLAALLYLVEYWTGAEEDLASTVRLEAALARVRISLPELLALKLHQSGLDRMM